MIKLIKNFIAKIKQKIAQKKQMKQMKKYYEFLQTGVLFMKFIQEDLQKNMNRATRRNFRRNFIHNANFSKETIIRYQEKIENVLEYIEKQKEIKNGKKKKGLKIRGKSV